MFLSNRIFAAALFVYTADVCVYISVHHQGVTAPQLHCKILSCPSLQCSRHSANQVAGITWDSCDWLIFSDALNDCWCLLLSLLDHFCSKCFLDVMMMSFWGAGPIRWGRESYFVFLIRFIFNFIIFSTLLSEGLVQSSGTYLDVQGGRDSGDLGGGFKRLFIFHR